MFRITMKVLRKLYRVRVIMKRTSVP